ncbi:hypothetical protein NKI04_33290 [Mesorhizobium sp. M0814]|uniref:hypothetical protein n=1 Tax=Mesorhizobium sp. M0814 TaxID=2957004 RepID=UPI003336370E
MSHLGKIVLQLDPTLACCLYNRDFSITLPLYGVKGCKLLLCFLKDLLQPLKAKHLAGFGPAEICRLICEEHRRMKWDNSDAGRQDGYEGDHDCVSM